MTQSVLCAKKKIKINNKRVKTVKLHFHFLAHSSFARKHCVG